MTKLYHATLDANQESIGRAGIVPNTRKHVRPDKSWTDLFGQYFLNNQGLYLPKRMQDLRPIDRTSAIFLSALPNEFRKIEHGMVEGEKLAGKDIVYECDLDSDLPAFDVSRYEVCVCSLRDFLGQNKIVSKWLDNVGSEQEGRKRFSRLMGFLMYQNNEQQLLDNPELRQTTTKILGEGVRDYCQNAVLVSDLQNHYGFVDLGDKISWVIGSSQKGMPDKIAQLEILCNKEIPKEKIQLVRD